MKYLISFFLITISIQSFSQGKKSGDDVYFSPKLSLKEMSVMADKSQLDRVINCLDAYHKQKIQGYGLVFAGSLIGATYTTFPTETSKNAKTITLITACTISIVGIITLIDAERWLSKKYLTFTGDKLTLNF